MKLKQIVPACLLTGVLLVCGCGGETGDNTPADSTTDTTAMEEMLMQPNEYKKQVYSLQEELGLNYDPGTEPNTITKAYTYVVNELVLNSTADYKKPFNEATLDLKLSNGTDTLTVPGFWDGKQVWRVRFALTKPGTWTYETVCSNPDDTGLNGIKGTVECVAYTGNLDLYKHGFVKTVPGTRYFVYDDGTPFFYLGDTHWGMSYESLENFKTIVNKRTEQGFTVIQSETLGSDFDLSDGLSSGDIRGLQKYDKYFQAIADKGLVHTNASLFFPSSMENFIKKFGGYSDKAVGKAVDMEKGYIRDMYEIADSVKDAIDDLCRYWVARYGAYPMMWTLGQEVDNDFYWKETSHPDWSYVNNPYVFVAESMAKYDVYSHPLSGHQEGMNTTAASDSAFRNCSAHTWFAAQWKWLHFDGPMDFKPLKDYWNNGDGKPSVDYEGYYCFLWTKNFGARAQGWMAYTNGAYGYGWGGQDTWCYKSTYDEDKDSKYDHVDVVTAQDKLDCTWETALEMESTYQMGYMRAFLEGTVKNWYDLLPRFDDAAYFTPASKKVCYCVAGTEDKTSALLYFYNFSDAALAEMPNCTEAEAKQTGTLGSLLPDTTYVYVWFDPVKGTKVSSGNFTTDAQGSAALSEKSTGDAVLYVTKA